MANSPDEQIKEDLSIFESRYKGMSHAQLAEEAVTIALRQLMVSSDFKKPRLTRLARYWELYDGKTTKKLRQLFNVPIPVFAGMIDTLNAQYDTPIQLKFKEGDPADYFKVQKINGAFQMEVMSTTENSKWDTKLTMIRKHAIINGIGIAKYTVTSSPEYTSTLDVTNLKNFHFQPKGGGELENHLFAGEEGLERTDNDLLTGEYDRKQVQELLRIAGNSDYLPERNQDMAQRLSRFKPLGLDPENNSFIGQRIHQLAEWILEIDGKRWYLCFNPWTRTWLRFEPWKDICSGELLPWAPYRTHEDDENLLSKSFADDAFPASDAVVALFNQDLTNREKKNFGARAYDKDMFTDVRKLDEAMHRPDALVPADTKGGTRRISEGIFQFEVGSLNGTVDLIQFITDTVGRNNGANDMAMGSVQDSSKKASVAFAEQKAVSKRLSWGSQPFQTLMASIGKRYVYGLKDHMPSKMAIRLMGEHGWDWDEITRLDLSTTKDVDVLIVATDKARQESEMRKEKRKEALLALVNSPNINGKKRDEEILRSIGEYDDEEIAEFLDIQTHSDKKSLAKASVAIEMVVRGQKPDLWYGATTAFMQKIVDYAADKRTTLGTKYDILMEYAMAHKDIALQNMERKAQDQARLQTAQPTAPSQPPSKAENPGMPPGVSRAMNIAELAI